MSGTAKSPELALISESVQSANARIKFFRVAYGAAQSNQQMGRGEIVTILAEMSVGGRFTYAWNPNGDCIRSDVRIAFLLIQCLESAMPYGGKIRVTTQGRDWVLTATTEKLRLDETLWSGFDTPNTAQDFSAADVHFALAPLILKAHRKKLTRDATEGGMTLRF